MSNSVLSDELRYQLLKEIEANPEVSQRELAKIVGVSLGKTNYCLKALIEAGWVKAGNFARSENKMHYAYVLTPRGLTEKAAVTLRFLNEKQLQFERLKVEIDTIRKESELLGLQRKVE